MTTRIDDPVRLARQISAEVVRPRSQEWDAEARWPEEAIRALQSAGLGGLVVPARHGGLGLGMPSLLEVCEALGEADGSVALCFGMHCVGTACIVAKATGGQGEAFLRPIAEGAHWTTLALSEPGTGSHFYLPETSIVESGDAYTLQGSKCFVTNGGHADSYVVSAAADRPAAAGRFSMVMVPSDALTDRWEQSWNGWGMRGNSSRGVTLNDVRVSRANRLGDEGDQIWYVFNVVAPYFLIAMAGTYLGIANRAVAEARDHLKSRTHSHTGTPLAEVPLLQHRLGTLWASLERTRRLCYWAALEADTGGPDALAALCSAKAEVGHAAVNIVNEAMTLVGGRGYGERSVLQRLLRDARAAHVMSPTTDILYGWVGRAVLDLPLLGE